MHFSAYLLRKTAQILNTAPKATTMWLATLAQKLVSEIYAK